MYQYELEQKEQINSRIQLPIGVLTLLIGLAVYYINNFNGINRDKNAYLIFCFFLVCFIVSLIVVVMLLFFSYYNYRYAYLPTPRDIHYFTSQIHTYYNDYYEQYFYKDGGPSKEELIKIDLDEKLYDIYLKATTRNMRLNQKKIRIMRYTGYALVFSVTMGLLTLAPYYITHEDTELQKVEIEQLKELIDTIRYKN